MCVAAVAYKSLSAGDGLGVPRLVGSLRPAHMGRRALAPLLAVVCISCADQRPEAATAKGDVADAAVTVGARPPQPGIRFDPSSLRPGQRIGALVADSVSAQLTVVDSTYVGYARFLGELELTGRIVSHPDADLREVTTCFEADSVSAARLPRWSGDERRPWFCFENQGEAERRLREARADSVLTVVIERFTINRNLSDAVNSASFVRLGRGSTTRDSDPREGQDRIIPRPLQKDPAA